MKVVSKIKMICSDNYTPMKTELANDDLECYIDYQIKLPCDKVNELASMDDDFDIFLLAMQYCGIDYDESMLHDNIRYYISNSEDNTVSCAAYSVIISNDTIIKNELLFTYKHHPVIKSFSISDKAKCNELKYNKLKEAIESVDTLVVVSNRFCGSDNYHTLISEGNIHWMWEHCIARIHGCLDDTDTKRQLYVHLNKLQTAWDKRVDSQKEGSDNIIATIYLDRNDKVDK